MRSNNFSRAVSAFRERVRTPTQFWLLTRMTLWGILLRLLRPILPLKWQVWLAVPTRREPDLAFEDIARYIGWLDYVGLLGRHGNCLPRALVCHHFLTLAGEEPVLFIGFTGEEGHAWIEDNGKPILEAAATINEYEKSLNLLPGSRKFTNCV